MVEPDMVNMYTAKYHDLIKLGWTMSLVNLQVRNVKIFKYVYKQPTTVSLLR